MVVMRYDGILSLSLLLVVACAACSAGEPAPDASHSPAPAANASEATLLPTDTKALPDTTPDEFDALLSQLHGTPVVVNFWGSWCTPCREEMPRLAEAAQTYGDRIQFLGVDVLDTKEAGRRFIDEFGVPFPSVFDPSPNGSIRNHLGYLGQPVTVFYDDEGKKVADWEGAIPQEELDAGLKALTQAPDPSGASV
ncbi:MAG: TlpA family protein disulfide reductase [Actinobacteria bacterium]|nr:TlpA family protein disulfide reductase [Actinomycetota bacterium]